MSQLSVFAVGATSVDDPPTFPSWRDETTTDLHAVVSRIPHVGHAKGTYREKLRRPSAYLYFRPDLLTETERERCFDRAESCTGATVRGGFVPLPAAGQVIVTGDPGAEVYHGLRLVRLPSCVTTPGSDDGVLFFSEVPGRTLEIESNGTAIVDVIAWSDDPRAETPAGAELTLIRAPAGIDQRVVVVEPGLRRQLSSPIATRGDRSARTSSWWVRLNGESASSEGREGMKPCSGTDLAAGYMLEFRGSLPDQSSTDALTFCSDVTAGALAVGCRVRPQLRKAPSPVYADNLAQLILAVHWSPVLAVAVWWALLGCEPKSDEWMVGIDHACTRGRPWAESLAKLSARPENDVINRSLRWMFSNKRHSP